MMAVCLFPPWHGHGSFVTSSPLCPLKQPISAIDARMDYFLCYVLFVLQHSMPSKLEIQCYCVGFKFKVVASVTLYTLKDVLTKKGDRFLCTHWPLSALSNTHILLK